MAECWGNCDYRQLQNLRQNLAKLREADMDRFCREMSKELAARLLALVIPRTPVGQYSEASGKKGGTLRRGWTAHSGREAECTAVFGGGTAARAYAKALPVTKMGNEYRIEVINPVEYASYVEFGHRTANGKGWVNGQYFLTISEQEIREHAPAWIEKRLEKQLQEAFNV